MVYNQTFSRFENKTISRAPVRRAMRNREVAHCSGPLQSAGRGAVARRCCVAEHLCALEGQDDAAARTVCREPESSSVRFPRSIAITTPGGRFGHGSREMACRAWAYRALLNAARGSSCPSQSHPLHAHFLSGAPDACPRVLNSLCSFPGTTARMHAHSHASRCCSTVSPHSTARRLPGAAHRRFWYL